MCKLDFKYTIDTHKANDVHFPIDNHAQLSFESFLNKKLAKYCGKINVNGSFINVKVKGFGKTFDWEFQNLPNTLKVEIYLGNPKLLLSFKG